MKRRKSTVKGYEDEPETVIPSIGSYDGFTEVPKNDRPIGRQIGFIRQPARNADTRKRKNRS